MPDVEIYDYLHRGGAHSGMQLERAMGLMSEVQLEMNQVAARMAGAAKAVLGAHHDTGASRITITQGKRVDTYVNLDDSRGAPAAAAIERGNSRGSDGLFALAAGILAARG